MTQTPLYAIRTKDKNDIPIFHLIDSGGCMTRCGHYSAWGSVIRKGRTGVRDVAFHDIRRADLNGKLCGVCLRGCPVETTQPWDGDTPAYKRRGLIVDEYEAMIEWLENERKTFVRYVEGVAE